MCRNGRLATDRTLCGGPNSSARSVALSAALDPQNPGPYRRRVPQFASGSTTARSRRSGDGLITRKSCTLGKSCVLPSSRQIVVSITVGSRSESVLDLGQSDQSNSASEKRERDPQTLSGTGV